MKEKEKKNRDENLRSQIFAGFQLHRVSFDDIECEKAY